MSAVHFFSLESSEDKPLDLVKFFIKDYVQVLEPATTWMVVSEVLNAIEDSESKYVIIEIVDTKFGHIEMPSDNNLRRQLKDLGFIVVKSKRDWLLTWKCSI